MCDVMYTMQYVKTTVWYRNDLSGKSLGRRVFMSMQFQPFYWEKKSLIRISNWHLSEKVGN